MAIRFSDALNSRLAGKEGLRKLLSNSQIIFFTGSQPTSANDSKGTSQEIIAFTSGDLQLTEEVLGTAEFDLTGITTAETITSITVSGVEILGATITYDTSATATAALVAAQINSYLGAIDFKATSSAETVTIAAPNGSGIDLNDATIVAAGTGVWNAASSHFQSNGVAATTTPNTWSTGDGRFATGNGGSTAGVAAANGLTFDVQSDGAGLSPAEEVFYIGKPTGETWKGKERTVSDLVMLLPRQSLPVSLTGTPTLLVGAGLSPLLVTTVLLQPLVRLVISGLTFPLAQAAQMPS